MWYYQPNCYNCLRFLWDIHSGFIWDGRIYHTQEEITGFQRERKLKGTGERRSEGCAEVLGRLTLLSYFPYLLFYSHFEPIKDKNIYILKTKATKKIKNREE